jgi:hypothetical protein
MAQLASMGDTTADFDSGSGGETIAPEAYELLSDAPGPLSRDELAAVDAWWRTANYLSVGQIYLKDNPLLREALSPEHIKPRPLGHFGTVPGLNLVWAHANRQIVDRGLQAARVRRCSTPGWPPACTPGNTARTFPRWRTGPGAHEPGGGWVHSPGAALGLNCQTMSAAGRRE